MKPIKIVIFMLTSVFILLFACNKEGENRKEKLGQLLDIKLNLPFSQISKRTKGFTGRDGSTEILVFQNMASVQQTINELDHEILERDSIFVTLYPSLNDDQRNDLEIQLNYCAEQPLKDLDSIYEFYSLYLKIIEAELEWLEAEELNHSTDPDNHFIFEHSLRALLNTDNEIQVGDSIYVLTENGYYAMPASSLKSLEILNTNLSSYSELSDVIFVSNDCESCRASGCTSNKRNDGFKTAGNYRIKWVVSHWTQPWGRRAAAKVDNYKKRDGKWKKYSTYCEAMVYGYISNSGGACDDKINFNPNLYMAWATAKHVEHKIDVETRTLTGWVQSSFYGAGGISHNRTLTW